MKVDAIFEGGGVRGIGFAGAVSCLEDKGYELQRLAGTSAGAVVAALLAAGYTANEVGMLAGTDFSTFLAGDKLQSIPLLGKPLGLLLEKGMYRGDVIEEWIQELLKRKSKTKFKDVLLDGRSRLKIIASDITKKEIIILPDDLAQYGFDPMEFEIARAVRMSASIPLIFSPVVIRNNNCKSYIVDGGVMSNFPVWIFDVEGTPRWPTFGFRLIDSSVSNCSQGKNGTLSYIFDILDAMINEDQSVYMRDKDSVRTISIPTLGVKSTDFNITLMNAFRLYQSGYESCAKFLKQWDFRNYVSIYRKQ